jgi:cell division protein FtsL
MISFAKKTQEQQFEQPQQTVQTVVKRKVKISIGELVLICALACILSIVSIKIISNQSDIYKVNKQIQQAEASIQEQAKVNEDLKVQVKELSEYERLWKKAEEFGLKRNENNVKVVQQ